VKELETLQREASRTDRAMDSVGKKFGIAGSTLKAGLVAGAAALVGTQLVSFLSDSAEQFAGAAKAAGEMAAATGGSVDEVSRLTAALGDAGIGADQTAGLLTKFTTNAGKNQQAIADLGVEMVRNKDGSIDYAASMVAVVDAIGEVGDASKRNQLLVRLFGKQGASAFNELYASGIKLSDAMRAISKYRVFTAADVRSAVAYDDAMDSMAASVQGVQFAIGRGLAPIIGDLAEAFSSVLTAVTPVLGVMASFSGDVYLVAGAALLLSRVLTVELVQGALTKVAVGFIVAGTAATSMSFSMDLAKVAAYGLGAALKAAFLSNPIGWVLLALTAAFAAVSAMQNQAKDRALALSDAYLELRDSGASAADASKQVAAEVEKSSGALKNFSAAFTNKKWWQWALDITPVGLLADMIISLNDAMREGGRDSDAYADALAKVEEEQGIAAAKAADAQSQQQELNNVLADGAATQQELTDAVNAAGQAQGEQNRITQRAKDYMDTYAATTWDAVNATLALFDSTFAANDAQRKFNDAVRAYNEGGFDNSDDAAAALDGIAQAALGAAGAAATAARDQDQLNGVTQDAAYYTQIQIDKLKALAQAPGMPQSVIDTLNTFIGQLEVAKAKGDDGVTVNVTADTAAATGALDPLGNPITPTVIPDLSTPQGVLDGLAAVAAPRTALVTIRTVGYNDAKDRVDYLDLDRTQAVTFTTPGYNDAKDRVDYLDRDITSTLAFGTEGYNDTVAKLTNLTNWRDPEVVVQISTNGYSDALRRLQNLGNQRIAYSAGPSTMAASAPAPVVNNWNVTIDGARDPAATVRAIERYARDNGRPGRVLVTAP